jgi:argininosuccinate lyase
MKGLPLAYDRDLQEDKAALFAAVDSTLDSLLAATLLVEHLAFDRDRLAVAASDPALLATDAAEARVASGTPFRQAHEEIGRAVRAGKLEVPWSAETSVRKRDGIGGPNPRRVAARAAGVRREAAALKAWSAKHPPRLPK